MNKKKLFYDLLLVFAISLISLILIFVKYNKNKEDLKAEVWFEGKVVQTIELDSNKELEIELTDDNSG